MAHVDATAQKGQGPPVQQRSVRSRPLAGKSFFLDLPSGKTLEFLEKSLKRFGGVVESFLSKEVMCIVSSNQDARKESCGRKQTTAVLRNTQAGTQPPVGKGRRDPAHKPSDAALVTRGKTLLQKAIGTQSNTCSSNSVLTSARSWGIQIMHTDDMFSYLQWLDSKRGRSTRQIKSFSSSSGTPSAQKAMRLQSPFLKVEDESRRFRPFLQQFKSFPELCFQEQRRRSPFEPPRSPASSKTPEGQPAHISGSSSDCCLVPKRQRGYCECCEETFVELQMHLQGPRHSAFVLDASRYAPVDSLIAQMTQVFADSSGSSLPCRVPPGTSGDHSGCQGIVAPPGHPQKACLSGADSDGGLASLGLASPLPEDQSLWQWTELLGAPLLLSVPSPPSQSGQVSSGSSATEHPGGGGTEPDSPLKPAASPEAGSGTAPQQTPWAPPALLPPVPRKRKLSSSPRGQVKKRPALATQPLPDPSPPSGVPPVGAPEGSFSQECSSSSSQRGPGCLRPSAAPGAKPHHGRAAPTPLPQDGSPRPPGEGAATDTGCLKQRPERKEASVVRLGEERPMQTPRRSPGGEAKLGTLDFPAGTSSQLPGSAPLPRSPGTGPSQGPEAVVPKWSGLGLPPFPCSEEPFSSESEWDVPLLCALGGPSRSSLERPIDSALLGTCVSVRDSGYESHLCSVLWQSLERHEACPEDSSASHGHRKLRWTPFRSLGACLDGLGPFPLKEPTPPC
ncbi:protein DBF4 homolog B [Paroedura picta]|uniref:protein DBF4 homolog B n=1 Tax=Paroedura picta TaxID=143630 RepID=UPI0040569725